MAVRRSRTFVFASMLLLAASFPACSEFTNFDGLVGPAPASSQDLADDGSTGKIDANRFSTDGSISDDDATAPPPKEGGGGGDDATTLPGVIAFIAANEKSGVSDGDATVTVPSPAKEAGDFLIATIVCDEPGSPIDQTAGFTAIPGASTTKSGLIVTALYKIATSADIGASYKLGSSVTAADVSAVVAAYSGVSSTNPIDDVAIGNAFSGTAPPKAPNAWAVGVFAESTVGECFSWSATSPTKERATGDTLMFVDSNGPTTTGTLTTSCPGPPGNDGVNVILTLAP